MRSPPCVFDQCFGTVTQIYLERVWKVPINNHSPHRLQMLGIGTARVTLVPPTHQFVSHLGADDQSWGYSYRGIVQHRGVQRAYGRRRFSIGCIVGVLADLRHGRLEFYLNRRPLGIAYHNIPAGTAGQPLYAYACSTAAKSAIGLIHASHHSGNLQWLCFRQLARCPRAVHQVRRVPGMRYLCAQLFYLHAKELYAYSEELPSAGERERTLDEEALLSAPSRTWLRRAWPGGYLDDELRQLEAGDGAEATQAAADEDGELDIYADLDGDEVNDESDYMFASEMENDSRTLPIMIDVGLMF